MKKTKAQRKKARAARREEFKLKGEEVLKKVRELVKEGNVRKITISDKKGKEIVTFPLTVGVVGAIIAPMLAAIGAIAALLTECTLTVERYNK
jgi:aryl-alcohol dehydrogenase-like predicted oxidoreductase